MNVAVVGASNKPERHSYRVLHLLRENGHTPFLVNPGLTEIDGEPVAASLGLVPDTVETVLIYVAARNQQTLVADVAACGAKRVIFTPGSENPEAERLLREAGVEVLDACAIVMLRAGQF